MIFLMFFSMECSSKLYPWNAASTDHHQLDYLQFHHPPKKKKYLNNRLVEKHTYN